MNFAKIVKQCRIDRPGHFKLADHDPAETFGLSTNIEDVQPILAEGIKKLAEMHFVAGATEVLPGVHGAPESITPDQLSLLDSLPTSPQSYSLVATHLFAQVHVRVTGWLNPWPHARESSGYQIVQGMYAFGSGHLLGTGIGFGLAPEQACAHGRCER